MKAITVLSLSIIFFNTIQPSFSQTVTDTISKKNRAKHYYELMKKSAYADPTSAKNYGRLAIRYAPESDQPDYYLAKATNGLGIINKNQGKYDSALIFFDQAINYYTQINDIKGQALAINNQGILCNDMGNYPEAILKILKAIHLGDSLKMVGIQAVSTNNLGIIQYAHGYYEKALVNFEAAKAFYEADENPRGAAGAQINIATILTRHLNQLEAGKKAFQQAVVVKQNLNDLRGVSLCYDELGSIYRVQNKYDSGIYYLNKAIDIKLGLEDRKGLIICYNNLAQIYLANKQTKQALYYGQKSYDLALQIEAGDDILASTETLAKALGQNQQYEKASQLWQKAYFLKDSLLGVKNLEIINDLQTKYETEKKEQQIALQQAEIAGHEVQNKLNLAIIIGLVLAVVALVVIVLLTRSRSKKKQALMLQEAEIKMRETQIEAAISSQEKERTRFAQDLHDGFGQMISILNLNLKSLEKDGSDREHIFEQSTAVLDEMYQELKGICFNLMPQTLIKSGITAAIQEFASRVNQTGKLIVETDFFGLEERLTEVQEISLYRITQEWINNTLKYSDADRVNVQITKDENEITLLIEDNGTGFDLGLMQSGKGNGWRNMNSRVNLIKGELEVDTTPGMRGSTLIVNAPATPIKTVTSNSNQKAIL